MGGAQPLAVTHERRRLPRRRRRPGPAAPPRRAPLPRRGGRRPRRRDRRAALAAKASAAALSVGVVGNAAEVLPELLRRGVDDRHRHRPDLARTTRCPTCPRASTLDDWARLRGRRSPRSSPTGRGSRWPSTSRRWSGSMDAGAEVFDYGNSIRDEARQGGYDRAFDFPGFVPAYIRPLFCEGKGPFRWAALSGDPARHRRDRPGRARPVPGQRPPAPLDPRRRGSGSRSRGCRPGSAGSATASATRPGCAFNEMVAVGRVSARRS